MQMAILMYPTIIATAILIIPSITSADAGREIWLSPIWGVVTGVVSIVLAVQLNNAYPKKSIVEYSVNIIGKYPTKILGILYIIFLLHITGVVIREYADFVVGIFMIQTPQIVVIGSMAFVCALGVRAGLEVLARTGQFFFPIIIFIIFLVFTLLVPEFDFMKLIPFFENGIFPSIKGAATIQSWYSEYFLITFMLPFLSDREKALKFSLLSLGFVVLTLILANLTAFLIFGELTKTLTYPIMSSVRFISVANFFENVEALVMALWVSGAYIKISVFFYGTVLATGQVINLSNYRPIVFPICFLIIIFGFWVSPSF